MERVRSAVVAVFVMLLVVATATFVAAAALQPAASVTAAVAWPVSSLVISEVQTGGASASDEFAEIANVGGTEVDLAGIGTGLCHVDWRDRDQEGELALDGVARSGPAPSRGELVGRLRLDRRRHVQRRVRRDGRGARAATHRRGPDRCGWLGRRQQPVRRGRSGRGAGGGPEHRATAWRDRRQHRRHQRQRRRLVRQPTPNPQNLAAPPVPASVPSPSPDMTPDVTATPAATDDAMPRAPTATAVAPTAAPATTDGPVPTQRPRQRPRPRRPPAPTPPTAPPTPSATAIPTGTPTVTPAPTASPLPIAAARVPADRGGDGHRRDADHRPRHPRIRSGRIRPGRDGRHRRVPRCRPGESDPGRHDGPVGRHDRRALRGADPSGRHIERSTSSSSPGSRRPPQRRPGRSARPSRDSASA